MASLLVFAFHPRRLERSPAIHQGGEVVAEILMGSRSIVGSDVSPVTSCVSMHIHVFGVTG